MNFLSPRDVLKQVAAALPADIRGSIIVIGSLAAGYRYFRDDPESLVQTKDVDCMLSPHIKAVPVGRVVAESLFKAQWRMREGPDGWGQPGTSAMPAEKLPLVRLHPPGSSEWFIELMVSPPPEGPGKQYVRLETALGHFSLCSFRYLALVEQEPIMTEFGIAIARPEMMALANLLHHPDIGAETMSGLIADREIKRSNKDLGRVLALAFLAMREDEDALEAWPGAWKEALQKCFPKESAALCASAGSGLRRLLESPDDMEEVRHCCAFGLLTSFRLTQAQLRLAGQRFMQETIEPIEAMAD